MNTFVFNQSHGHWLLSNALHVAITMTLKLKKEYGWFPLWLIYRRWYGYGFGVVYVCFQHYKASMWCFGWFSFISSKVWREGNLEHVFLMLDPRFKSLRFFFLLLIKNKLFLWWKIMLDGLCFQWCWNATIYFILCYNMKLW